MADLKTTYKDDVLNTSANEKRKYNMITNEDGTVSLVDATDYLQVGDSFGAADINATNEKVNELNTNLTNGVLTYKPETDYFGIEYNGEWKNVLFAGFQSRALIPILSSDSGYGVTVSASSKYSDQFAAYKAFDGLDNTIWGANEGASLPHWLLIKFTEPVIVSKFDILFETYITSCKFKLQGSNDNSVYTDLTPEISPDSFGILQTFELENVTEKYTYYRLYITSQSCTVSVFGRICTLQLYGSN